jgi:4-hydroxybenzoate polyprenyltransferase
MVIVSLLMVLAVGGLWAIDPYFGAVAAVAYVVYAGYRLMKANSFQKYLIYNYGV